MVLLIAVASLPVKHLPAMWEGWVQFLGQEDPLEKGMATHVSILAWRIPWTGVWQPTVYGIPRVRHDLALSFFSLLQNTGSRCSRSVIVAHGVRCPEVCEIFLGQGSNPCPLHWQVDS